VSQGLKPVLGWGGVPRLKPWLISEAKATADSYGMEKRFVVERVLEGVLGLRVWQVLGLRSG